MLQLEPSARPLSVLVRAHRAGIESALNDGYPLREIAKAVHRAIQDETKAEHTFRTIYEYVKRITIEIRKQRAVASPARNQTPAAVITSDSASPSNVPPITATSHALGKRLEHIQAPRPLDRPRSITLGGEENPSFVSVSIPMEQQSNG